MSIEDAAIMSRLFSDPAQVFLLLKPSASEPGVAGFFIWEDGTIHRESTYLQFPFQNSKLRSGRFPVVEQPAPRQPVPPGKPRIRHFDTRRMIEEFTHELQPPRPQLAAPAKKVRKKALYTGMATALIVVAALLLFQIALRPGTTSKRLPLALNVAWEGNRLRLTWNRKAPAIRSASRGVLSTTDGARQQFWNLDTTQLTEGSIVYWPVTNDVNFRLDVFSHENSVGESVRSLGTPPESAGGPQPVAQSAPPSGAPKLALPVQNGAAARTRRVRAVRSRNDGEPVAYVKPSLLNSHSSQTVPQPLQSSSTPPALNPAPERRPLEVVPPKPFAQEPVEAFSTVTAEPVSDSRIGQVLGKVPLIRRLRKPSTFAPPRPLREVSPVVPSELRRGIRGQVPIDIKVYVNESGRVDYAELMSNGTGPNRSLASQAVYAARRWEFEPAHEGERKVPGQVILHYRFGHMQMASQR